MQKYMAMALFSGMFIGLVIADGLHWINAVIAMLLYVSASVLANMPKGPQGQKRPADSIGMSVLVARIATGEIDDTISSNNKSKSGRAGAAARNSALTREERSEIAKTAAWARWNDETRKDNSVTKTALTADAAAQVSKRVVQMYPNNRLKDQVRQFDDTKSAFSVVKDEFFTN